MSSTSPPTWSDSWCAPKSSAKPRSASSLMPVEEAGEEEGDEEGPHERRGVEKVKDLTSWTRKATAG